MSPHEKHAHAISCTWSGIYKNRMCAPHTKLSQDTLIFFLKPAPGDTVWGWEKTIIALCNLELVNLIMLHKTFAYGCVSIWKRH